MPIEQITIERNARGWIVAPLRANFARLWFYAPGIEIYVKGEDAAKQFEIIANIALNECLARHIPTPGLKTVYPQYKTKSDPKGADGKPTQLPLFETNDTTGQNPDE